ncbi:T9SS type A sorting domain-containing protein [Saccharicrinis sp. GN24d3]|uniref:T9SS type A sorting domain-containing protein n=1 Tax=Saccharicrinis sp. GN24d3 TaxID=3458416 RepID=UPI0040357F44
MKLNILVGALLLCLSVNINATDYYVAKTGDDSNPGTLDQPFLTISKAASIMVAGDICYIKEGVYREILSPTNSGTEGNPITYTTFEQDNVVIDATEILDNWTNHSGDIYKANTTLNLGVEYNVLFCNDSILDIARWPNNEDNDRLSFDGHEATGGSGSHITANGLPSVDWTDGYVCYLGAHSGMSWTREITSSGSGQFSFTGVDISKWPFNPHNPTVYRNENRGRFYLFGKLDALDYPGEWFYDGQDQTVYCMLPGRANPEDVTLKAGARLYTMQINKDYIHIDGLSCFGGTVEVKGNYCVIKNGKFQNCLQSLDELDNTDAQIGNAAIKLEGSNITVENNLIEYGSGNGISMLTAWKGSKNYTIHNNVVRHFNTIGVHANPIRSNCPGATITNNTIYSCGRDGIYTSGANSTVAYNDVFDCMKINNDGGVFYTVGNTDLKNTVIHHNWFHDSYGPDYADGRAAGIYLDNNSKGYDVHHNVVWNITWNGLMINWYNTDINFYNNTIWKAGHGMGRWANGYNMERIKVYNNYSDTSSDGAEWIGTNIGSNIINGNQPFVSVEDTNFVPSADSYLIDAGTEVAGITDGFNGSKPDIGAYEYGQDRWIAGADWAREVVEKDDQDPDSGIFNLTSNHGTLKIFPNPAHHDFRIVVEEVVTGNAQITVYAINGKPMYNKVISDAYELNNEGVYFSDLNLIQGVYMIRILGNSKIYVGKLMIK